jgi:hypothetical protein
MSRSIVEQPDWLLWVRRAPPQEDAERVSVANGSVIAAEPQQERVEWPGLPERPDSASGDVKIPKRTLKFEEVYTIFYFNVTPF